MIAVSKEAMEKYEPDLILFALSNGGALPFLWGTSVRPYFRRNPSLWEELFGPECPTWPGWMGHRTRLFLVEHLRLYRYIATAKAISVEECNYFNNWQHELKNIEKTRDFLVEAQTQVKVVVFLYPGAVKHIEAYQAYFKDLDVPVISLSAGGMPAEYFDVHPPPYVTTWYGEKIAQWLNDEGLWGHRPDRTVW